MVCCWSKQRQAWTRARRVNRCGGALTAPSRPTGTWRRDASPRSCSHRVLPANTILACHATTLQPRPFASKDRRNQLLLRVQPERNGKRKRDGSRTPQEENARAVESLVSAFRRTFLERNFPHSGADGDARRGHVIRRIIGQNFVAARIYVVRVCVYVCVLVREREIFAPFLPFFQRLSSAWSSHVNVMSPRGNRFWMEVFFFYEWY